VSIANPIAVADAQHIGGKLGFVAPLS